jgi:hypothetical protein
VTSDTATYVFCLVQSSRTPSLRGVPKSVPGAGPPRILALDRGLWAVVADAPLERFSSERLEHDLQDLEAVARHALAHASIVEFFFRRAPVIPLQLFTLFSQDERARRYLVDRSARLRKLFARLRGLEEWGVRIVADPEKRDARSVQPAATGRDYLVARKRSLDRSPRAPRSVLRDSTAALKALGRVAVKVRKEAFPPPGPNRPFVTGASFLVKASRRGQWKKLVASLTASLKKRGHRLQISGPWPPYHFASSGK